MSESPAPPTSRPTPAGGVGAAGAAGAAPIRATGALYLECTRTGTRLDSEQLHGLSPAGAPLFARYDLEAIRSTFRPEVLPGRSADLWRYAEVLPVRDPAARIALGRGGRPSSTPPGSRGSSGWVASS
jgi:threonine synthase